MCIVLIDRLQKVPGFYDYQNRVQKRKKERAEKQKVPSVKNMAEKHDIETLKKKALGESTCLPMFSTADIEL